MKSMPRFFPATAYAGHLYLQRVSHQIQSEGRLLVYWDEVQVDAVLKPHIGDRKVQTPDELATVIRASRLRYPAITVWIVEGLEGIAVAMGV